MALRDRYLFVCTNRRPDGHPKGSCGERGSEAVLAALKSELANRGLAQVTARACAAGCLDQCSGAPTVLVEPDHFFYGRVTPADAPAIVDALARGGRVERLVLSVDELAKG